LHSNTVFRNIFEKINRLKDLQSYIKGTGVSISSTRSKLFFRPHNQLRSKGKTKKMIHEIVYPKPNCQELFLKDFLQQIPNVLKEKLPSKLTLFREQM